MNLILLLPTTVANLLAEPERKGCDIDLEEEFAQAICGK